MKKVLFFSLLGLFLATTAAVGQDVRYNFDRQTNFSKYKTYQWVVIKDAPQLNSMVDKQIKDAIDAELATKGLTKVEGDTADLFVGYQTSIDKEKEFTSFTSGAGYWGYGGGWYRGGWYGPGGMSTTTGETSTIYVGQLVVDMYDSANKSLVWRGLASKTLDTKAKPDKQQKNLAKAVKKLLKNYPPSAK